MLFKKAARSKMKQLNTYAKSQEQNTNSLDCAAGKVVVTKSRR